jgi:hypothetical protein
MPAKIKIIGNQKLQVWVCGVPEVSAEEPPPASNSETWKPRVQARLTLTGSALKIENRSREPWPELTARFESDEVQFDAKLPPLKTGEGVEIPLSDFAGTNGIRLPQSFHPKKASVGGNGFQFGAYGL